MWWIDTDWLFRNVSLMEWSRKTGWEWMYWDIKKIDSIGGVRGCVIILRDRDFWWAGCHAVHQRSSSLLLFCPSSLSFISTSLLPSFPSPLLSLSVVEESVLLSLVSPALFSIRWCVEVARGVGRAAGMVDWVRWGGATEVPSSSRMCSVLL